MQMDFPVEPEGETPLGQTRPAAKIRRTPLPRNRGQEKPTAASRISLNMIITEGLLSPPVQLSSKYRGRVLTATIQPDGSIIYEGRQYWTPSIAGGAARKPFHAKSKTLGDKLPSTNGWTFWQLADPVSGQATPLDTIRNRFLEKKKAEAMRFVNKESGA